MINYLKFLMIIIFCHIPIFSHCQIPCGIYSDATRIFQINEDLTTIEKAMQKIIDLSLKSDPRSLNQLNRWVTTKEDHAKNIQKIVSSYFLTQRIKIDTQDYPEKVILLHKILVSAMKCKQTTDKQNISYLKSHLETFSKIYLDEHGIEHLNKLMK